MRHAWKTASAVAFATILLSGCVVDLDLDGDGLLNLEECLAGTDAGNADSRFEVQGLEIRMTGQRDRRLIVMQEHRGQGG